MNAFSSAVCEKLSLQSQEQQQQRRSLIVEHQGGIFQPESNHLYLANGYD